MEQHDIPIEVLNVLPAAVQSRIPGFRLLHRSASLSILSSLRRSMSTQREVNEQEVMVSSKEKDEVLVTGKAESSAVEMQTSEAARSMVQCKLEGDISKYPGPNGQVSSVQGSGVKWRYAAQGSYMHHTASQERDDGDFARKSYIDGVAYLLRALPDDLDEHESSIIRRALPESCAPLLADGRAADAGVDPLQLGWPSSDNGKTLLHRVVRATTTCMILLAHLFLSVLVFLIRAGAHYEREYNISQKFVSHGLVLASAIGKYSVVLSGKMCAMSDGKVGRAVSGLTVCTVENVTRGIQDGIGNGLLIIEQKEKMGLDR
ncbi:hypothetical protein F5B20DRAFT_408876 [Whalleya microplaca]|nr:hypothetical protein F5B20DRAFT_408876 [Whalleya microplaca]